MQRDPVLSTSGQEAKLPQMPANLTVHKRIIEQAAMTPDSAAVLSGDKTLTYKELDDYSRRLASLLSSLAGPEQCVALYLDRGIEIAIGIVGILRASCVYVPIDPEYPAERLQWMLQQSETKVVITSEALLSRFEKQSVQTICIDVDALRTQGEVKSSDVREVHQQQVACLIYTSGSTGVPKGVEIEHGSLVNTLSHSCSAFRFASGDVMAVIASFSFDISLLELVAPWFSGACSLIFTREEVLNPELFFSQLSRVTVFLGIPSFLRHLLGQLDKSEFVNRFRNVRRILIGGELVPPELIADTRGAFPQATLSILYGPTETTLICTEIDLTDMVVTKPLVGRPIANMAIYILDSNCDPVSNDVIGEIYVAGKGVSRCYRSRPDLTAVRFVPDPFSNIPGSRMYKTGDLGRRTENDVIEFAGRSDRQVKIRGHRIEPAEIDTALVRNPGVQACVTIDVCYQKEVRLVSYVVQTPGFDTEGEALLKWLRSRLPNYMVPSTVIKISKIPLTVNGKLDRSALPLPDRQESGCPAGIVPGLYEHRLLDLWKKVLQTEHLGIHDNFFDVGGHSLLLARLRSMLVEEFGCKLSMVEMFNYPTIALLAKAISGSVKVISTADSGPQVSYTRLQQLQQRRVP